MHRKTFKILSIDGGGVRGVIPAVWLAAIFEKLDKKPEDCFDLVVGTSTGAIIAAALCNGINISSSIELYEEFGPRIFPDRLLGNGAGWSFWDKLFRPTYEANNLESALKELFGSPKTMGESKIKLIIPTYDAFMRNIFLIKSYEPTHADMPVWEACKASSSAPTYFPAHIYTSSGVQRPLIDGGVFANNPSMLALSEAIEILGGESFAALEPTTKIVLISIGTGSLQRKIEVSQALKWGPVQWVRPLIDVLFDGTSELSHVCAKQILKPSRYVRMQVDLHGVSDDMDDASPENLNKLKAIALGHLAGQGGDDLQRIVELIDS